MRQQSLRPLGLKKQTEFLADDGLPITMMEGRYHGAGCRHLATSSTPIWPADVGKRRASAVCDAPKFRDDQLWQGCANRS
jgi:hypothetical protein